MCRLKRAHEMGCRSVCGGRRSSLQHSSGPRGCGVRHHSKESSRVICDQLLRLWYLHLPGILQPWDLCDAHSPRIPADL